MYIYILFLIYLIYIYICATFLVKLRFVLCLTWIEIEHWPSCPTKKRNIQRHKVNQINKPVSMYQTWYVYSLYMNHLSSVINSTTNVIQQWSNPILEQGSEWGVLIIRGKGFYQIPPFEAFLNIEHRRRKAPKKIGKWWYIICKK